MERPILIGSLVRCTGDRGAYMTSNENGAYDIFSCPVMKKGDVGIVIGEGCGAWKWRVLSPSGIGFVVYTALEVVQ